MVISVNNLTCGYHKTTVLKNISLEVEDASFLGIIGPNGSGKSTLLRAMSRTLKPFSGNIYYERKNIYQLTQAIMARDFAFVPQDTIFNFQFTVGELVLMGRIPFLSRMQAESREDIEIVRESMRITDTLRLYDRLVSELSAGERQMVIVAKALAQQPKVLFLDEPTSHLDIGHQVKILNLLKELNRKNKITIIMVLHDLNLASEYCDKLLLLNKGEVYKLGTPAEVLNFTNIEEVYQTLVLVNKNPISGNPHVLLVRKEKSS